MKNRKVSAWAIAAASLFFVGTLFPYAYAAADGGLRKIRTFVDVLEYVKENYVENTDTDQLITGAIKGVVGELDDFSQYLEPKDYKTLKNDTRGDFGGLGIRLQMVDGYVTIMSPMPGTPAFKAGVMPGDRILFVDDQDLSDMRLDDAVDLMRGEVGTKVKLTLSRKDAKTGEYKNLPDLTLKRQKIIPEVVYHRMLPGKIGYVYVVDFSGHTMEALNKALKDLQKQGMQSLVLDLRFNPGGLLNGAVDMAKLFMGQKQMIVYTKGRKPEFYQEFKTDAKAPYADIPMVVLVNQGSASASEIVSGALQDNKRAVVVGQRTFGKASVQQVMPLSGGAGLRLTIAKYYTPSGKLIQRDYRDKSKADEGGIFPDIEVEVDPEEEIKVFMQYNNVVYTPGKAPVMPEFKEADPVLDKAVAYLKGELTLEQAQKEAQEAKEKKAAKKKAAADEKAGSSKAVTKAEDAKKDQPKKQDKKAEEKSSGKQAK